MKFIEDETDELPLNHAIGMGALACAGIIGLSLLVGTWIFGNPLKPIPDLSLHQQQKAGIKKPVVN